MRKSAAAFVLICAAVGVYAFAVILLHSTHRSKWDVEQLFPIPVAASYLYYGTRFGTVDGGLWEYTYTHFQDDPDAFLSRAASHAIPSKPSITIAANGSGFGSVNFTTAALFLFGPRAISLVFGFLVLMSFSTVLFFLRFPDSRLLAVPILYSALTLVLLTPFANDQFVINQAPVGGTRFFVVAGILPAAHLILELFDQDQLSRRNTILAILQLAVMLLAASIRLSTIFLLFAVLIAGLIVLAIRPHRLSVRKLATVVLASAAIYAAGHLTIPKENAELGLTSEAVWHRAIVGLGAHPKWPFGDLSERINCKSEVPDGFPHAISDNTAWCFYFDAIHKGSPRYELLSSDYDRLMRTSFLQVLHDYPKQTIETFLIYKPQLMWAVVSASAIVSFSTPLVFAVGIQLLVLLLTVMVFGIAKLPVVVGAFALLTAMSVGPQVLAWSSLATAPDLICFKFAFPLLAITAVAGLIRALFLRKTKRLPV